MSENWAVPTVAEFKANFFRDFPYAPVGEPNNLKYVTDLDIQNAMNESAPNFPGPFGDSARTAFFFAAAHNLVCNIRNSTMGLNSQAKFLLNSASVGGVSVSNNINERFARDPILAGYLTTGYGVKFLNMAYGYTIGNVGISYGRTSAA